MKVMIIEYHGTTNRDYVMLAKVKHFSKQMEDKKKDSFVLKFNFDDREDITYYNVKKFSTEEW